jgi:hypothetical protein
MAIIRKSLEEIKANRPKIDRAKMALFTETDIRQMAIDDGEDPDAFQDQVATKSDIAILKAELAVIKWLIGSVAVGVLLLIIKSFWPHV